MVPDGDSPRDLDVVQRWFQAVISHPGGIERGMESAEAQKRIAIRRDELERVVRRSRRLDAGERLSVYANAYYARLLECLGESFPVLRHALGEEAFNEFAFGYLQRYPSRSYTLSHLGDHFSAYLDETRPDRRDGEPTPTAWPDFLIDLARLEWAIGEVFDGPGVEGKETFGPETLQAISPDDWPECRLVPVVCLRLLEFRYPVNDYYTAVRRARGDLGDNSTSRGDEPAGPEEVPPPDPARQFMAITRRDFIVRRFNLEEPQYLLLQGLRSGRTVRESIQLAASRRGADIDQLAVEVRECFETFTGEGFFQTVEAPRDR